MITYFVFAYDLVTFYAIDMTTLSVWIYPTVLLSVLYLLISLVVVVYAIKATLSDPSDPTIYE